VRLERASTARHLGFSASKLRVPAAVLMCGGLLACQTETEKRFAPSAATQTGFESEPIRPLPDAPQSDARLVALGKELFFDGILSADGSIRCASCHDVGSGGDDGKPRSTGIGGKHGGVNAPTVLNSGNNFVQFWDGRAATLEDQAGGPIENPLEMGSTLPAVVAKVSAKKEYKAAFAALFPDGVTASHLREAIAAFERTLVTPDAPIDRYLRGDANALTAEQKEGYELFKSAGCIACHQGANVGGNMFQRFGVLGNYFAERGNITQADYGRFNVTHEESDRHVFRVPSLRNVELTAPYFHDGTAETLDRAVRVMAKFQLGRQLTDTQVDRIVAFLKSLTGKQPQVDKS
jgi:cytochrome c peroxidase